MAADRAMFYFDTNIDAVANDIAGALGRINASLEKPLRLNTAGLASNTAGLGQLFSRLQGEAESGVAKMRNLIASGANPEAIREGFRSNITETFGRFPQIIADEIGKAPSSVAATAPLKGIAEQAGRSYVQTLRDSIVAANPELASALGKFPVADFNRLSRQPAAFGSETSARSHYENIRRAEGLIQGDPALGKETMEFARQLGYTTEYMKELQARTVTTSIDDKGVTKSKFTPTDAGQRLRDLANEERQGEAVAIRKERETVAQQTAERRRGIEQIRAGYEDDRRTAAAKREAERQELQERQRASQQVAAGREDERRSAAQQRGLRQTYAQQTEAQRIDEGMTNASRLLGAQQTGGVMNVGRYRVMGDEIYKVTNGLAHQIERGSLEYVDVLKAADAKVQAANARQVRAGAGQSGALGGFFQRFTRGGVSPTTAIGQQIGAAAGFTLGYGALFGAVGAIADTKREFMDYQDSLTDLQVATRNTDVVTNEWVNDLGELSRVTGENLGAALDTAARGVRAFGDPLTQTRAELQAIGTATNTAANQLALISDKSLKDATGDTIAAGTAYGLQPDQLTQVVDAVANAKRSLGGDPAQISQGLSNIASSARSAGFDLNQAASVISLVQARTDESGQAVATRLSRIFQTISGTTGKRLGLELGVDTNQSARKQLEEYSKIYTDPSTSKAIKDRITSALGGTANLRELLPILQEGSRLQSAYGEAARNAGQGESEFSRKSDNLVGVLKKVTGDIRLIQVDLARSGIFAPLGLGIEALEPALHLLDRMLKLFDDLPGPIKSTVAGLLDVAIAAKAVAAIQTARLEVAAQRAVTTGAGVAEAGAEVGSNAARDADTASLTANTEATAANTAAKVANTESEVGNTEANVVNTATKEAGAAEKIGVGGGLASIGRFLINPTTLAVGSLLGGAVFAEKAAEGHDQTASFRRTAADSTVGAYGRIDGSASSLRAAANDLHSAAGQIAKSDANAFSRSDQKSVVADLKAQQQDLNTVARRVAAEEARYAQNQSTGVFGTGPIDTVSQLTDGLTKLRAAGVTAVGQLRLVNRALNTVAKPENAEAFHPQGFAASLAGGLAGHLREILPETITRRVSRGLNLHTGLEQFGNETTTRDELINQFVKNNRQSRIGNVLTNAARQLGIHSGDILTEDQKKTLAMRAADAYNLKGLGADADKVHKRIYDELLKELGVGPKSGQDALDKMLLGPLGVASHRERKYRQGLLNGRGALTAGQVSTILTAGDDGKGLNLLGMQQDALNAIPATDDGSQQRRILKQNADELKRLAHRVALSGQNSGELNLAVRNAEDAFAQAQIEHINDLRRAAQNQVAGNKHKVRSIGIAFLKRAINAAGADTAALKAAMVGADQAALDIVEASLKRAAILANQAQIDELKLHPIIGGGRAPNSDIPITDPQKALDAFRRTRAQQNLPDKGGDISTGHDAAEVARRQKNAKKGGKILTPEQREARRTQALEDPDTTVKDARNDLNVALADLHAAKKGTSKYYDAMKAVNQAKNALGQAQVDHSTAVANANAARIGGGLAEARASLHAATAGMKAATRGTTEWYNQLASYYQAREQMRQAVLDYRTSIDQLHGDITDPVEQARDALREARRKLGFDRGQGRDVRAEDRVGIRQADAALQDAKFQQRLSDMQTGEDLGRISFAKYMSYLDHEHERLSKIHHRTRQQQDELDTVDKAMKDALNSMDAQFNLGNINTNGLVYQVRRFAAENHALMSGDRVHLDRDRTTHQTVTISINGADTAKVKSILDGYLRINGGQRRTLTRRKV